VVERLACTVVAEVGDRLTTDPTRHRQHHLPLQPAVAHVTVRVPCPLRTLKLSVVSRAAGLTDNRELTARPLEAHTSRHYPSSTGGRGTPGDGGGPHALDFGTTDRARFVMANGALVNRCVMGATAGGAPGTGATWRALATISDTWTQRKLGPWGRKNSLAPGRSKMDASFIFVVLFLGVIGVAYYASKHAKSQEPVKNRDLRPLKSELGSLNSRISTAESAIQGLRSVRIQSQQNDMGGWLVAMRERLDEIESRQRRMRTRLDTIESKLGGKD